MNQYKHGGEIYDKQVTLDFSVNVNPLGLPKGVKKALINNLDQFSLYPDQSCRELKKSLAAHEGINKDYILCGNGASDLIYRICQALKPKHAILPSPTFSEYEKALKAVNCPITYYPMEEGQGFIIEDNLIDLLDKSMDMLFLCNPNNPIGNLINQEVLKKIVDGCFKYNIFLVMDECFLDFTEEEGQCSLKRYVEDNDRIFILKAFTKIYAMAGLRLGYGLCSNKTLLDKMEEEGPSWSVSMPAQIAGVQALKEYQYLEETKTWIKKEKKYLYDKLVELGLKVYPPKANYIFFKSKTTLYEEMLFKGILIRQCGNYYQLGNEYYRVAVRGREENQILIDKLKECLNTP